jgi:pyruvate/2-oxoglutarate dehydrogenase complex dihydrolipoamide acyltransferase (E2) component
VFVELPEVGAHYDAEKEIAVVESVKAAADVYAPIAGTVTEVNQAAADAPESVNADAYAAWLFKMTPDNADVDALLDAAAYQAVADAANFVSSFPLRRASSCACPHLRQQEIPMGCGGDDAQPIERKDSHAPAAFRP